MAASLTSETTIGKIAQLAQGLSLFGNASFANGEVGFKLGPQPFALTAAQVAQLQALGPQLLQWVNAQNTLYAASSKPNAPLPWVAQYLNQGKPDALLQLARNKRFKHDTPLLLRPDLLLTSEGFTLTELDSVPGGLGFLAALHHVYQQAGFTLVGHAQPLPQVFAESLLKVPHPEGVVAVVVSQEANDYWAEWSWLIGQLPPEVLVRLVRPEQLYIEKEQVYLNTPTHGPEAVGLIYRFFELFDLNALPKWPLIQYAIQKGWVVCTPPLKPHLEEKLWQALWHNPACRPLWQQALPQDTINVLDALIPPSWVLDPTPVPPFAHIAPMLPDPTTGVPVQQWQTLGAWGQKARQWVIKPSGFSPLAWGSRGVTIGHDVPQAEWQQALDTALQSFGQTPYVLQQFRKPMAHPYQQLVWPATATHNALPTIETRQGRTRLCPYYWVNPQDNAVTLLGVLATTCPADKKIIHGMKDAVMAPCYLP
jgi:hypothetical protein